VNAETTLAEMDKLVRRDPAQRGLIAAEATRGPLCSGHLAQAASHLVQYGRRVILVTGFYIPSAKPPAAETDGPPGTALLAQALKQIGLSVLIVTDAHCFRAVNATARFMGLTKSEVVAIPSCPEEHDRWFDQVMSDDSIHPPLTHLIALERVGPSHTRHSLQLQLQKSAARSQDMCHVIEQFDLLVPLGDQDRCHNMRGECIDAFTAPLHKLFERSALRRDIHTIGIGDGGNEIGMGSVPWHELSLRLNGPHAPRVPCRIATDWTILAGVSNWGGQALAASVLTLSGKTHAAQDWTSSQQLELLKHLVTEGPAVDGITHLQEPTVDGLPFLTYIQPWIGLRRLMGLSD
jgi:D-glutamate cyclase